MPAGRKPFPRWEVKPTEKAPQEYQQDKPILVGAKTAEDAIVKASKINKAMGWGRIPLQATEKYNV